MTHAYVKMSGTGNDFVVVQTAGTPFSPTAKEARAIADREHGIGCDQIIALGPSSRGEALMRIWNADGAEVEACGNGARCVGWLLLKASGRASVRIETASGLITARPAPGGEVSVDMGPPGLDWSQIPLARPMETDEIDLTINPLLRAPGCVSMGNPHVVFFVPGAAKEAVREVGPLIETHPLFPRGANVGFATVETPRRIRLRVWERGAGLTAGCGTGACAAVVAAHRRGLAERAVIVAQDGGEVSIDWRESDGHVLMTGPVKVEGTGRLDDVSVAA